MNVTVHRGTRQIGGTCIELASGGSRIILDIGMPLPPLDGAPRKRLAREELVAGGILPVVDGLFDAGAAVDGILLSHSHGDHSGLVHWARPSIPVHMSKGTSMMLMAGARFAGQPALRGDRQSILPRGVPRRVGAFRVTAYDVDHSVYGANAFLIEDGCARVLYTGDLRVDGAKRAMTRALLAAVRGEPVDLLIIEGTRMGQPAREGPRTETELRAALDGLVAGAPGLVLGRFSPQNLDRLVGFYKAARRARRVFVIDLYAALVMHLLHRSVKIPHPCEDDRIRIFIPRSQSRVRGGDRMNALVSRARERAIAWDEIVAAPARHVMLYRPRMLDDDFGGSLPPGTLEIYSLWHGYREQAREKEFARRLARLGARTEILHASGHASEEELVGLAQRIGPRAILPVHTDRPWLFKAVLEGVLLPGDGETCDAHGLHKSAPAASPHD